MFFDNSEGGERKKMLFCNLYWKPDNNSVLGVERISINTTVQTDCLSFIVEWTKINKSRLSPETFFYNVWPQLDIRWLHNIYIKRKKNPNVSLLMLELLKFSWRISNWTRTTHSIKQHGTHCSPPIKYIALPNYDGSNSSCLFSFCGQIWLKKWRKMTELTMQSSRWGTVGGSIDIQMLFQECVWWWSSRG